MYTFVTTCVFVVTFGLILHTTDGTIRGFVRNCKEQIEAHPTSRTGEYTFINSESRQFTAYCEFRQGYGYMFISRDSTAEVVIHDIDPCTNMVLVRHERSNRKQYDTRLTQISSFDGIPLSIQYNKSDSYNAPLNRVTLAPYLYLGFLPKSVAASGSTQGYSANGRDFTFSNCDSNPNSYLAFFFDKNHGDPVDYHTKCCYTPLMRNWIDVAEPAPVYLTSNYFYQFEMHMGGCGGYAINGYNTLTDIFGAALGFRFEF